MVSTVIAPLNTGISWSVVVKVVLMHSQTTRHDRILYSISKRKLLLWSAKYGTFLMFCMLRLPCFYSRLWNYVRWLWQDLLWKPQTHLNFCIDINLTSGLLQEQWLYSHLQCIMYVTKGITHALFCLSVRTRHRIWCNGTKWCENRAEFTQIEPEVLNERGFVWMLGYLQHTWIFFAVRSAANTNSPPSKSSFKYRMALQA